jgi:hypothetical protein
VVLVVLEEEVMVVTVLFLELLEQPILEVELVEMELVVQLQHLVVQVLLYFVWQTANYSGTTTGSPTVTTNVGGSDTVLIFNASGSYTG